MCASLSVLALVGATALAGCGGGSPSSASSSSAASSSPVALTQGSVSRADAVAFVAGAPIAKSSYEHWLSIERALGVGAAASHQALGFLITSAWVAGEAAAQHVSVSEAQDTQRFALLKRQSFPKAGSFERFLATSHESEADLRGRVKLELLESRITAKVTAAKSAPQGKGALASFTLAFKRRWKSRTTCETGYLMEDCSEYKGQPEGQVAKSSTSNTKPSTRSPSASSTSSAPRSSGEVYSSPGAMSISSPAFELNGAIPSQYTCDGSDVSPPLEWQKVPAKAAALVLFIIDDTSTGPASGIRWVVGDISPSAKGVAAGRTPEGGIVGSDTQGHGGYGGICPSHGTTSTIEFVLYALKKPIPLSPGFQPSVAESEYGAGKDLLGSAAVTYAVYRRP